jgi:hypothetical protein
MIQCTEHSVVKILHRKELDDCSVFRRSCAHMHQQLSKRPRHLASHFSLSRTRS